MVTGPNLAAQRTDAEFRGRRLAQLSLGFLLDEICLGLQPLSTREAALVLAINQGNIAALTRDPDARRRYGRLEAPAPDHLRRPVSINAVAMSLGMPFETVRRHVRGLETLGVCVSTPNGVIVPQAYLGSSAYLDSVRRSLERLRDFYFTARRAGLVGPLPAPAYEVADGAPLRAAARLLSDYILRASQAAHALAGDLISALVLLAVIESSLAGPAGAPRSASAIARRLGLPEETVRRHAVRIAMQGLCLRTSRGLAAPPDRLADVPLADLLGENAVAVQRLFAQLAERGVIEAWEADRA